MEHFILSAILQNFLKNSSLNGIKIVPNVMTINILFWRYFQYNWDVGLLSELAGNSSEQPIGMIN